MSACSPQPLPRLRRHRAESVHPMRTADKRQRHISTRSTAYTLPSVRSLTRAPVRSAEVRHLSLSVASPGHLLTKIMNSGTTNMICSAAIQWIFVVPLFNGCLWRWPSEATDKPQCKRAANALRMMKAERLSGARATRATPGDAEVMGKVGSAPLWPRISRRRGQVGDGRTRPWKVVESRFRL